MGIALLETKEKPLYSSGFRPLKYNPVSLPTTQEHDETEMPGDRAFHLVEPIKIEFQPKGTFPLHSECMATIYAGTSGWAYSTWKPGFYPAKLGSTKFLGYYASRLNSVELNYTFRRFPTEKLLTGWIDATPPGFKFAVKAHQSITHVKRLRNAIAPALEFMSELQPLNDAGRLGPVLFQLPPFLKCDLELLKDFTAGLPRKLRVAFEFRHASWFSEEVFAILRKAGVALCQAESETLETPEVQTADFSYFRLRKACYSTETQNTLTRKIRNVAVEGDVFAYFKHEETPEGALFAESLLAAANTKTA